VKRALILTFGMAIGLGVVLGSAWLWFNRSYQYHGFVIDPPARAADFTLVDQNNRPFRLSEQKGKAVLIFFGYSHCPDVCPLTLSEYRRIKQIVTESQPLGSDAIQFVFITVDPQRDTPAHLQAYLSNFDPTFVGLSGETGALEQVWKDYGVYQARKDTGSAAGYLVDHSARLYLIDPQGNWRINYSYGTDPEVIARDLLHLLKVSS
jgi:protein SCO1